MSRSAARICSEAVLMPVLSTDCPHCRTASVACRVFGSQLFPEEASHAIQGRTTAWHLSAAIVCPVCHMAMAVLLDHRPGFPSHGSALSHLTSMLGSPSDIRSHGYDVIHIWPEPERPAVPEHVPDGVARAMLQAERNFGIEGNEEAAGMMYRRALELAFKDKFASTTGSLAGRTKKLVEAHEIPYAMGDWANEIRSLGNDAAHDEEEIDREELIRIRGFADAMLRYLYTLPAEVEARRKLE